MIPGLLSVGHSPTLRLGVGVDGACKPEQSDEQGRGGVAREDRGKWFDGTRNERTIVHTVFKDFTLIKKNKLLKNK